MSPRVNVLIYNPDRTAAYVDLLTKRAPELRLLVCESEADVARSIKDADVLFVSTKFPTRYVQLATRVRWIQAMGAGVERFAKDMRIPDSIAFTRVNTGFGEKISEYVLGYMLARTQRMRDVVGHQQAKRWEPLDCSWLYGETLGVAGVGAIGGAIARKARAFDMHVIGFDLIPRDDPAIETCYGFQQLLEFVSRPRFISISLPLTSQTEGLFDLGVFEAMRADSILINTARGGVVREADLIDALQRGVIGGAVLDVFEQEPLAPDSPLWEMENVIITPHHAGPSVPDEMVAFFLDNLDRWQRGATMHGVVDREKGF